MTALAVSAVPMRRALVPARSLSIAGQQRFSLRGPRRIGLAVYREQPMAPETLKGLSPRDARFKPSHNPGGIKLST
jgi:hypothetical protein